MRKLGASLLASLVSGLAGGVVAQQLAVWSGAGEEFILVFFALAAALVTAGAGFFLAQFFGRRGVDIVGLALTILVLAGLGALWFFVGDEPSSQEAAIADLSLLGALGLAVIAMIAAHWLTLRLMQRT